jgi:hypothetical protein
LASHDRTLRSKYAFRVRRERQRAFLAAQCFGDDLVIGSDSNFATSFLFTIILETNVRIGITRLSMG